MRSIPIEPPQAGRWGLDYYTGAIFEVTAPGFPGSIGSGGRYDELVAKLGGPDGFGRRGRGHTPGKRASRPRAPHRRVLGSSGKLAKQLKWADDQRARRVLLYGPEEQRAGVVTVRDMESGEQTRVPLAEVPRLFDPTND